MNLSRRSLLTSLIAAPAVIAADRLMPIKLWLPTIYGDGVHDDWEGLQAWARNERVNISPPVAVKGSRIPHQGVILLGPPLNRTEIKSVYYSDANRRSKNQFFKDFTSENAFFER